MLFFHAAALSKKLFFSLYLREKGCRKGTGWGGVSLFVNFCTTFSKCVFFARACFYSSYLWSVFHRIYLPYNDFERINENVSACIWRTSRVKMVYRGLTVTSDRWTK